MAELISDKPEKVDWKKCDEPVVVFAQVLYEAYIANSDGLAWDGRQCPEWGNLNDAVRSHWCAVVLCAWVHEGSL